MDYLESAGFSLLPNPAWSLFMAGFLVGAVLVARRRPAWLLRLWLVAWLLGVAGTLLSKEPAWLRQVPVFTLAEIALVNGVPTGLTALWLHLTRRHAALSLMISQLVSALAVFACGLVAVEFAVVTVYNAMM